MVICELCLLKKKSDMKIAKDDFYLKGNTDFNDRQKTVFEELDKLGSLKPQNRYTEDEMKSDISRPIVRSKRKDLTSFRGKESIFKRPEAVIKKSTKIKVPDFVKNPHKWKKYVLDDENEVSERSNTAVAMAFLKEMETKNIPETSEDSTSRVTFNKHFDINKKNENDEKKSTYVNGKFVMPEYVIGQKEKREKKKRNIPLAAGGSVKLDHLSEETE